jgi:type II secretion system protein J
MQRQPTFHGPRQSRPQGGGAELWWSGGRGRSESRSENSYDGASSSSSSSNPLKNRGRGRRGRFQQLAQTGGFTLIEILLAVGIFAIVLFAMNTVFYSALKLERAISRSVDERTALNHAFAQLRRDLRGAVPPMTNSYLLPRDFLVTGGSGRLAAEQLGTLEFYTTTGRISDLEPWSELQRVRYELVAPTDPGRRGQELVRIVSRNILATATEQETEQLLVRDVESLEFECFDGATWSSAWDTTAADVGLPQAVRVRVLLVSADPNVSRLNRDPLELMVPLMAQSLTNTVDGGGQ